MPQTTAGRYDAAEYEGLQDQATGLKAQNYAGYLHGGYRAG